MSWSPRDYDASEMPLRFDGGESESSLNSPL